ncbi:MAG: Jag N-terminal domain-containing protein [Candidatus Omnitrophica bacterium]|nr:Jag N-terminal domain-containing protein [Candidatus Omnitrophota bacterium]
MRPDSSIEVESKTVEEAIKKALKTLKLSKNQVKVEVLSEEKKGLFGMPGAKLAKIRVTVIKGKEESSEKL